MAGINVKDFSKLTTLMFAASLDQRKWVHYLEHLTNLFGGATFMTGYDVVNNLSIDLTSGGLDNSFVRSYREYYGSINPFPHGLFKSPVGTTISNSAMCSRRELEKSEFYNDWLLPQEDIIAGGGAILLKDKSRMFIFGGNIRRKDEYLEKDWLDLVRLMIPHMQSSLEVNRVLVENTINRLYGAPELDASNTTILIVNKFGKIVFANQSAQANFDTGLIIKSDHRDHLKFTNYLSNSAFCKSIHALNEMNANVSSSFECDNLSDHSIYTCRTMRFDPRNHDISPLGTLIDVYEPCILLTINRVRNQTTSGDLITKFNLSQIEAEVVLKVSQGQSILDIAFQREVSIHTIRNQRKSGMTKMNVRKQVDLVNLINGSI